MALLQLLIIFILAPSYSHAQLDAKVFNTSVIRITKDAQASVFKVGLGYWGGQSNYVVDLDAPFTWEICEVRIPTIPCAAPECNLPIECSRSHCVEARSYVNPICPSLNVTDTSCRMCAVNPINPVSKSCKTSQLTSNFLSLARTNGRNPSNSTIFSMNFVFSCAPTSLLRSFPKDVVGVAAFSWSGLAFPRQLANYDVVGKFALCLPSSASTPGVTFLGDGPFYFLPSTKVDIRSLLSYTPMIRKSSKSLGYYIRISKISIKGTSVGLPSLKSESVKLSSVVAYTTLRSDIYKAVVKSFSEATKTIPRVKAVKPFSLCMKSSAVGSFRTVPKIELETESGKIWTISGENSMKDAGNGAACFAFLDGGSRVKDAIVIGSFQMENNFLFFDLVNQKLGFSSSLLGRGTSCSGFNFTEISG